MKNLKDMNNTNMLKRLFTLVFVLGLGMATAWAYSFSAVAPSGQTLYYTITDANNHYVQVVAPGGNSSSGWNDYTKPTGDLTLPSVVNTNDIDYSVTSINEYAFYGCSGLTSVTIGNSVTSIGWGAFYNCSGLTSVTIGNSVTSIGNSAFCNCSGLTSVYYTGDIAQWCGISFYYGSNPLKYSHSLYINNELVTALFIPNSVTMIGSYAFQGCSLTSVEIPNSVTSIGDYAFNGCSELTSVEIPNSVTTIGDYAFNGCSELTSVTIGEGVSTIGVYAFWNCPSLTTLSFNAINCTRLYTRTGAWSDQYRYYSAFSSNDQGSAPSFVTLNIGDHVTRIPDYAFSSFTSLTGELTIPNSVTLIGNSAFSGCSGLTGELVIPNSVTSIGNSAFSGCRGITGELVIPNPVTSIGGYAFYGCIGLTSVTIGNSVTSIGENAFYWCTGLTSVTIGNSVTTIGQGAFSNCSGLTSVTIGNSVTDIGPSAFYECVHLTSVYYLGDLAQWCNIIFRIRFIHGGNGDYGSRIENVSSNPLCYAHDFYINNELLTDLVIPETVTTIKSSTFAGASFHTITIHNSVTSI